MRASVGFLLAASALAAGGACRAPGPADPPAAGDPTCTMREAFRQVVYRPITFLFVIDDSASMCDERANLRANLAAFVQAFRASAPLTEFHLGVVSADVLDPNDRGRLRGGPGDVAGACRTDVPALDCTTGLTAPLPRWVDETTPEPERTFACLADVGLTGAGASSPLGALERALEPAGPGTPATNPGFYLPGSALVVVLVSDEDDCTVCREGECMTLTSSSAECVARAGELTPPAEIADRIRALPNGTGGTLADTGLYVVSIIGLDPTGSSSGRGLAEPRRGDSLTPICSVPGRGSAAPAPRLQAFAESFPDYALYSLCDDDFGAELGSGFAYIGMASLVSSFCLAAPPCPGVTAEDIVIRVNDRGAVETWTPRVDFDLSCADLNRACYASSDATCPDGWRIDPARDFRAVPSGAEIELLFACDGGDGCAGPP